MVHNPLFSEDNFGHDIFLGSLPVHNGLRLKILVSENFDMDGGFSSPTVPVESQR